MAQCLLWHTYIAHAHVHSLHTVFIRIVATATINFSLAGVRLLIEVGSYSRAALLISERYLLMPSIKTATQKTGL